ncbi:hypothetical protein [Dongshaea marina]|uniref:hypothetical protein n=1 Tax=Dongshaea marina TaxID=2047966 RepID=UPI000D3E286E|nr:hypothetical protein [Dongshaea marina]
MEGRTPKNGLCSLSGDPDISAAQLQKGHLQDNNNQPMLMEANILPARAKTGKKKAASMGCGGSESGVTSFAM